MSMPPMLTEAARSSRPRLSRSKNRKSVGPARVLDTLSRHILLDGFKIVLDQERSSGSHLVDAANGHRLIDLYGFFGSLTIGFNHPYFDQPEVQRDLLRAAKAKVANSDVYSESYAEFVETFARVAGLRPLSKYLFVKFDWPRVSCPHIDFSLAEPEREKDVITREKKAEQEIRDWIDKRRIDICAIIIEPIQGEGGDNHFRGEWLKKLRRICDENDILLIFDEVQCGMGATGKMWCCQHFDILPDLLSFGKKAQTCGVMAGPRLDEVNDNAFRLPSRLNSTWGGNLTDMVRSMHYMHIIEKEFLVENAAKVGA